MECHVSCWNTGAVVITTGGVYVCDADGVVVAVAVAVVGVAAGVSALSVGFLRIFSSGKRE